MRLNNINPGKPGSMILLVFNGFLAVVVFFLLYQYFFNNDKIAYVDSVKLMKDYKGAETAKKEFEVKARGWQSNIDTLEKGVRQAMRKYEKDLGGMNAREQKMARELIDNKRNEFVNYQKAVRENANEQNAKLMEGVISKINAFLLGYGKKGGYKMILIANNSGTIAYARDGLDVTAEVVEELNREYIPTKK